MPITGVYREVWEYATATGDQPIRELLAEGWEPFAATTVRQTARSRFRETLVYERDVVHLRRLTIDDRGGSR